MVEKYPEREVGIGLKISTPERKVGLVEKYTERKVDLG